MPTDIGNIQNILTINITSECFYIPRRIIEPCSYEVDKCYVDLSVATFVDGKMVTSQAKPRETFAEGLVEYQLRDNMLRYIIKDGMVLNEIVGILSSYFDFDPSLPFRSGFKLNFDKLDITYMPDRDVFYIIRKGSSTMYENIEKYILDNRINKFKFEMIFYIDHNNEKVNSISYNENIVKM